jgi:hypothetical protein
MIEGHKGKKDFLVDNIGALFPIVIPLLEL